MKFHFIIIGIYIIIIKSQVFAYDYNNKGVQYPHGVSSSGLNTKVNKDNNVYNISGGKIIDKNLFNSFDKFNLHKGEKVIFDDNGIINNIGRITSGTFSWINGEIKSGALNLYLLNSNGIVCGPDVILNIEGSFHISTADYLLMDNNDRFYSIPVMEKASKIISKSNNVNSGKAGTITINARKNISIIGNDTSISTSNSGDGKGGDIFINSDHLLIKNSIISSESLFTNYYTLKSIEELNKYFISTGDIVVITNKETNKKTQYVNTSNNLIKMQKNI